MVIIVPTDCGHCCNHCCCDQRYLPRKQQLLLRQHLLGPVPLLGGAEARRAVLCDDGEAAGGGEGAEEALPDEAQRTDHPVARVGIGKGKERDLPVIFLWMDSLTSELSPNLMIEFAKFTPSFLSPLPSSPHFPNWGKEMVVGCFGHLVLPQVSLLDRVVGLHGPDPAVVEDGHEKALGKIVQMLAHGQNVVPFSPKEMIKPYYYATGHFIHKCNKVQNQFKNTLSNTKYFKLTKIFS